MMTEDKANEIQTNLSTLRQGIPVQRVAKEIGISRGNLYNLESGKYLPSKETAERIANFYDQPIIITISPAKK